MMLQFLLISIMGASNPEPVTVRGIFFGGRMEGTKVVFGITFSEIRYAKKSRFKGRHEKNPARGSIENRPEQDKKETMGSRRVFKKSIQEEGMNDEILVDTDFYILQGGRRWENSDEKTDIPYRMAMQKNIDNRIVLKIIWKGDGTREQRNPEEIVKFIVKEYGYEKVMENLAGGDPETRAKSPGGLSVDKMIEEDLGYPASTVRNWLSKFRQKERSKGGKILTPDVMTGENINAARTIFKGFEKRMALIEDINEQNRKDLADLYSMVPKTKGRVEKIKEAWKQVKRSGKLKKSDIQRFATKFKLE